MTKEPLILGIDTSCDDTSVGIVRGARVLANIIASQDDIHRDWGGVVPNLARRAHQENFPRVLALALKRAKIKPTDLDAIAVTYGPGLAVSLEVGIEQARQLAETHHLPLIAINHLEAHLLSPLAANRAGKATINQNELKFPVLGILVSGGHTEIILIENWEKYRVIGETVDDAIGEAFDKVARLLGLGFPGGAILAKLAQQGNASAYRLPTPMRGSGDLNVSYSGLKTAARRLIMEISHGQPELLDRQQTLDIAAVFERTAVETLVHKIRKALEKYPARQILIGGGSAANSLLRTEVRRVARLFGARVLVPANKKLCSDNGAMVALVGSFKYLEGKILSDPQSLDRNPQLKLAESP